MKINHSKVSFSSIVGIGQKVAKASKESGMEYLALNRGVNAVVNVDLSSVAPGIDVNTNEFQIYAPNLGVEKLRRNIAKTYFESEAYENVSIMPGGMPGLDMILQTLGVENVLFPKFFAESDYHNGFVTVGFDQMLHYIQLVVCYYYLIVEPHLIL